MADNKYLTLTNHIFIEKAMNDGMSCKEIKYHTLIEQAQKM